MSAAAFAAVFAALYAAHSFGDHWVQTHRQACGKGAPGAAGRIWCARHVISLTITKLAALLAVTAVTGLNIHPAYMAAGLGLDATSHYWADRRSTLQALAKQLDKADFYKLGEGLGSGAYALDQSFHLLFLFIAALIMAGGA
ncbi:MULTISPECIES: transcriptional regulator [unclassified Nonomuraea]|uniref:transcriptional regulator n=1 Tax=unclassified Nonomuraea TaxID=2593643 RepID=UPI0033DD480B